MLAGAGVFFLAASEPCRLESSKGKEASLCQPMAAVSPFRPLLSLATFPAPSLHVWLGFN
jgi:hypothetical protein